MTEDTTWTYEKISTNHANFFRILAILPFENRSYSFIGTRLLSIYCHLSTFFFNTMYLGYGVQMIIQKSFEIDFICELTMVQSNCLRYLIIYLNRQNYCKLMDTCKELWQHLKIEEGNTVREFAKKAYYCRIFLIYNTFTVSALFIATSHFVRLPPDTVNGTAKRILPLKFYVDVQEDPAYTFVVILQSINCFSIGVILPGIETAGLYLMLMACGFLRVLQNRLLSMPDFKSDSTKNDILLLEDVLDCTKFHKKILIFCKEIQDFMGMIFLITLLCSVYNLALIAISLLENSGYIYKYISLLCLNTMQLFVCQWGPEHILTESEAVGCAAYFAAMQHPQYDQKANKILLVMMLKAQKPIQMKAAGYIDLSMETFGSMVTSSLSFFTVLRSMSL